MSNEPHNLSNTGFPITIILNLERLVFKEKSSLFKGFLKKFEKKS